MRRTIEILFLTLIGLGLLDLTPAEVTHEDIRGTIQSLIYSYNQLDNKLERHEHRERALGELMKKAMQALQKGQKSLEPINGIFGRLDERVSQIETMLITQEEKYNIQTEKLGEALEHIFKWMRENDECYKRPPGPMSAAPIAPAISPEFVKQQEHINKELLAQVKKLSSNVEKQLDASKDMMQQTEIAFKSVPLTSEMLTKIEDKLVSYSVVTPAPAPVVEPVDNSEFENKVFDRFDELTSNIALLRAVPKAQEGLTSDDKEFIHALTNETLKALENVRMAAKNGTEKALAATTSLIKESEYIIDEDISRLASGVTQTTDILTNFYNEMNTSYSKLNDGLEIFNKFNNILMANSEYVLETQRKVEFSSVQVVQKIGEMLTKQRKELAAVMKERFDTVDEGILNSQVEAIQNISATIETEMSNIWRQISIMQSETSDSKDLLTLMNGRTEVFVNTTFSSMDTMGAKVDAIKSRMFDMDSNLNFLLGKLSLMSQEFNNIKIGLAKSLEELRNNFHTMQEKMPSPGTVGPHNIDKDLLESLLMKRHAPS